MATQRLKVQDELLFGTIAVREGYVTPAMIDECLKHQDTTADTTPKKLGLLLIQKGHMTDEQVASILDIQRRQVRAIEADPRRGGLVGHLCLDLGFLSPEKLEEAVREQEEVAMKGQPAMLGQILLRRSAITTDQFLKVLKLQRRGVMRCPGCDTFYNIEEQAEGVKFVCRRCGTIVKVQAPDQKAGGGTDTAVRMLAVQGKEGVSGQFGRYVILEEIGRGGMGIVYKALHRDLNSTFALKTLKESDLASTETVGRFRREAQAAARLKHPNIVAIHDAGEEQGIHYLVMDYVEGRSLAYRMAQRPKTRELVAILEKVARAVHHAHEHEIIHRDIKPGNVMIDKMGEPKVMDFGLAKFMDHKTMLTRTGSFLGTPFYMAPEQIRGEADQVDGQSDVYAMGVILYEMISGRPPHMGQNSIEIFNKILNEEAPDPLELNPKAHPDLKTICLKAIEKEKSQRYKTAAEFADDLKRYLDGEAILARAPSVAGRLIRKLRQNSTTTLTTALVLALALVIAVFVIFSIRDKREFERVYNKGREAFAARNYAEARLNLEAARQLRPSDADVRAMLQMVEAKSLEEEKRREEAGDRARRLAQAAPKLSEASALLDTLSATIPGEGLDGPAVLRACVPIEAILVEALEIAPHAAEGHYLMARSRELRGDIEGAVEHLGQAIERDDQHIDAFALRGRLRLRRLLTARLAVVRPDFSPDSPAEAEGRAQAVADLGRALKAPRSSPVYREFAALAIEHLERREWRVALGGYLSRYAADIEALRMRGEAADIRRVIKYRPLDSGARLQLGHLQETEGNAAAAQMTLRDAAALSPGNPYPWCVLGSFFSRHRPGEAEAGYLRATAEAPESPVGWLELGRFRAARGQFEASLSPLGRAAELSPGDPLVFYVRAQALSGLARQAEALADADAVVRMRPDAGAGYELRGRIEYEQKSWEPALVDFERAAVRDPSARARLAPMVEEAMRQKK